MTVKFTQVSTSMHWVLLEHWKLASDEQSHICGNRILCWNSNFAFAVYIKFVSPVSGLLLSVETQTSAMHASTSVVFAPGSRWCTLTVHWPSHASWYRSLWNICVLSLKIYGKWLVRRYTCAQCSHTSARLYQARPKKLIVFWWALLKARSTRILFNSWGASSVARRLVHKNLVQQPSGLVA